ncbi:MAG: cysteine desulfurase family protein [bacterium]|nr:cysteine desulfurase family protein [bacterium]
MSMVKNKKNNIARVYLDNAATTPTAKEVLKAMTPYFFDVLGNPSALHFDGRRAKGALGLARQQVAKIINAESAEIIFCGSGTESDNLAILGAARLYKPKGAHLLTTNIEHHAVLHSVERLENKEGFKVSILGVEENGIINSKKIFANISPETILISVMYANNEIGTIQPIKKIGGLIKKWKQKNNRGPTEPPFFHTDACQAAGYLDLDVKKLGVDLMTLNGSKIYGPKGVGVLYVRRGISLEPLIFGGGQERGLRSGTENLAGIVGFAKALELAQKNRKKEISRLTILRDYFFKQILKNIPKTFINGDLKNRLPNNVNVSILDIEGEAMLLYLDEAGVSASTGSACDSSRLEPSHVILALGRPYEYAHGSLRFTLGKQTTKKEIDYTVKELKRVTEKLRKISPLNFKLGEEKLFCPSRIFVQGGRPHWERKKINKPAAVKP